MRLLFWFSLCFIAYTYVGYLLLLAVWTKVRCRKVAKGRSEPFVSVIIAAHNEERHIGNKIRNCLALDYPADRIEVIVVSDGSTDRTGDVVRSLGEPRVVFLAYEQRRGKAHALAVAVDRARGELLFFTDARQTVDSNALRELVANFNDPTVGTATGELCLLGEDGTPDSRTIGAYWKLEKWMRMKESQIHSVLGATGSVYACRKQFAVALPAETILDDMYIPFRGILHGYRSVFEPGARAYDDATQDIRRESRRKIRTLAGNYQLLLLLKGLLNPWRNPVFIQYVSHKLFRLLVPFFMVTVLGANLFLSGLFYRCFLSVQVCFYALAASSRWAPQNAFGSLTRTANVIVMLNVAAVRGLLVFLENPRGIPWEKTT